MQEIQTIETERLRLRAPRESDATAYQQFYSDAEASKFYGGPKPANEAWNKLARDLGHWYLRGYGPWTVERKDGGGIVGSCGLIWPDGWPRSELTWWIATAARRQGFAKEASRAAIRFGYDTLRWDLVQTHMKDENTAAISLTEALGGVVIGREVFPDGIVRNIYKLPRI